MKKSIDLKLLKMPSYIEFAISSVLHRFSYTAPTLFLPDRAVLFGHSTESTAILLTVFGATTMVGRIGYGIAADSNKLRAYRLYLYISAFLCCGAVTIVNFGEQFYHQILFAGLYGFCYGETLQQHLRVT